MASLAPWRRTSAGGVPKKNWLSHLGMTSIILGISGLRRSEDGSAFATRGDSAMLESCPSRLPASREGVRLRGCLLGSNARVPATLEGKLDAVILAWAGLHRLSLHQHITQRLAPPDFLPAVGQGALGIECRAEDDTTRTLLLPLDDAPTHRAILAERTTLAEMKGGCLIPIAAWARDIDVDIKGDRSDQLALDAAVFDPNGHARVAVTLTGPREDPHELGFRVAQALCAQGAEPLLERTR